MYRCCLEQDRVAGDKGMRLLSLNWPMLAFALGFAFIAMTPEQLQGPVLLVNEEHSISLVDALGIAMLLPALIRANLRLLRIAKGEGMDSE